MNVPILGCLLTLCLASATFAQSTSDLEPPITASSFQIGRSPDPAAIHSYQFATAEIDDQGDITIATKTAKQTLMAPDPNSTGTEFDPRGIRVTKNNGALRYRDRTPEEQADFEKRVAERKAKQESGELPKPATSERIQEEYVSSVTKKIVDKEGKVILVRGLELRERSVWVLRGQSTTEESISTKVYRSAAVKCFGIDGSELDQETIKTRLRERKPVVLIPNTNSITPFFANLLNPDAVFIVTPRGATTEGRFP